MQLDFALENMPPDFARYIKNLSYFILDTSEVGGGKSSSSGVFKPYISNNIYDPNFSLPDGINQCIGFFPFKEENFVIFNNWNSKGSHGVYRINGETQTIDKIYVGSCLNFKRQPEFFIHEGGAWIEVFNFTDPATGLSKKRSYYMFTDGNDYQKFICLEDSFATNGFDAALFPYFVGNYDPCILVRMGVPTPKDCIAIDEIPLTDTTQQLNNNLLFNTWQFRLSYTDVWGRPSEYGIISDIYIPGGGDCITQNANLPRCLNLTFDTPPPHINAVEIAFRNCNAVNWETTDTIFLYEGSNLGDWWLRSRNPKIPFDPIKRKLTYQFCNDKSCNPIDVAKTNRLSNPLPRNSQAVAKIGKSMGLWNNKDGFLPFPQSLRDKIKLTVEPPNPNITNNVRNATILVEIYNPFFGTNQPIFQQNISAGEPKAYGFGAYSTAYQYRSFFAYKQYFKNEAQKGFIGYLAGTGYSVVSKQFVLHTNGVFEEVTDFTNLLTVGVRYFQQFEFTNLAKAKYVFRIAGHQSDPAIDPKYQETSTYTAGTYGFNFNDKTNPVNHGLVVSEAKELIVDLCAANYDSKNDSKIMVIFDCNGATLPSGGLETSIEQGYVKNTNDSTKSPYGIELLKVDPIATTGGCYSRFTDHNGFYFISATRNRFNFDIYGYCNCVLIKLRFSNSPADHTGHSGTTKQLFEDNYFMNDSVTCPDYEIEKCNVSVIKGKVLNCATGKGVPNVSVVYSRGHVGTTDDNGDFSIIAADDTLNTARVDDLYYIPNVCPFTDCFGNCVPTIQVVIQKCITCAERIITVASRSVLFVSARGLLSGGTYSCGVVGWDWLGRPQFVQQLNDITIPSSTITKVFAPSRVRVDIDPTATFPAPFEYLTFWLTDETTIADYITWIADEVTFIDNTGLENKTAPTQIKIKYASLIEYNKQNNFNTTVNWQFIAANSQIPTITDKVQFLVNGDGTFFDKTIIELVKYDQSGQFFLINYNPDLANLKANAFYRLTRPKVCEGIPPYFEICSTVNLIKGKPEVNTFYLNAFDTYYLYRQIPVPTTETTTDTTKTPPVVTTTTFNSIRNFGLPFEHNSPSNFWGQGCHNIGRENIFNPYETELFHLNQCALSGAIAVGGQLNFLNYFDEAQKTDFDTWDFEGVVSVLPEVAALLVICQNNSFTVGYNDNILRTNSNGEIVMPSAADRFGKPNVDIGNNYGCLLFDKNTIRRWQGLVEWLDVREGALIQHDFKDATPVSHNSIDSWLQPKIKYVQEWNRTHENKKYFVGGINPAAKEYWLTDFLIGGNEFVNQEREIVIEKSETIAFDIFNKFWREYSSCCPEYYAYLQSDVLDLQMFTFKNGIPYYHYTTREPKTYNTFFGVKCERIFRVVAVVDAFKKKNFTSMAVYCRNQYFADKVVTDSVQESRILISQWNQADFYWSAPFLCNVNTPSNPDNPDIDNKKIMEGDMLYGSVIDIRLVGVPQDNDKLTELLGVTVFLFPDEPSGTK